VTETDPAAGRLDAFLERLDRVGLEDLRLLSPPLPDREEREALLADVDRLAEEAGRKPLVETAGRRTREAIERAYARHQYEPTWAGLNWGRSLGTTNDRLGLALAAEDAAVAVVVSDLLDEDAVAALSEPFERAAGMAGSTGTPSLSLTRPNRIGWLVWAVLAAGLAFFLLAYVGTTFAIVGFALIGVAGLLAWRRPAV
jgi:hypothetical protein